MDAPSTQVDWSAGAVSLLTEDGPWPRNGGPAAGGRVLVRDQRHQRARDPRGGAGRDGPRRGRRYAARRREATPAAERPWVLSGRGAEAPAGAGAAAARLRARRARDLDGAWTSAPRSPAARRSTRRGVVLGGDRAELPGGPRRAGGRRAGRRRGPGRVAGGRRRRGGVRVPGPGLAVGGDGARAAGELGGVRGAAAGVRRGARARTWTGRSRTCCAAPAARRRWSGWTWCSRRCSR